MPFVVSVEVKRVQTWLFGIPELKCMVGANTLLGEVVRGRLDGGEGCLAGLAIRHHAALPAGIDAANLGVPASNKNDPIHGAAAPDNPRASWQAGILSRDGGHFIAVFPDEGNARAFLASAMKLMGQKLPGLGCKGAIKELRKEGNAWAEGQELASSQGSSATAVPESIPQFQICEVSGRDPASVESREPDGKSHVSADVANRRAAADRFNRGESGDIIGLLRRHALRNAEFPADFSRMARSGYLAVIVADGNGMGAGVPTRETFPDYFKRQAEIEKYFHGHRYQMRMAVKDALADFANRQDGQAVPVRPMMLGGDDLVVACDAPLAFRLITRLAGLVESQDRAPGKKFTLGAGIAIVKSSFPFHRAHALAEQLAASAKVRWRSEKADGSSPPSMVDWLVTSEAWHDDLEGTRGRDAVRRLRVGGSEERLVLSRRPYPVRSAIKGVSDKEAQKHRNSSSLEGLLNVSDDLRKGVKGNRVARSQVMCLADTLPLGKRQGIHAARDLPDAVKTALSPLLENGSPWDANGTTGIHDLLDIHEISSLAEGRP